MKFFTGRTVHLTLNFVSILDTYPSSIIFSTSPNYVKLDNAHYLKDHNNTGTRRLNQDAASIRKREIKYS